MAPQARDTYPVKVAGVKRDLRLFEVAPGIRIAIVNILGDTELVQAVAAEMAERLKDKHGDGIVTAEAKSIPLLYALAGEMKKPGMGLRKSDQPYMGEALQAATR